MCAIEAGRRGRSVLVLERNSTVGEKIRISGGGRCNFTNVHTSAEKFISANANFHKSALSRYTPEDFIRMVRLHGIAYQQKKLGRLFFDGSCRQIIEMLLQECKTSRVEVRVNSSVASIKNKEGRFQLSTTAGDLECKSLVIATGGLSIPKMGATDFGYKVARQFGLRVTEKHPALVPLTLDGEEGRAFRELSGFSLEADVSCGRTTFQENVLFTHHGLSGPAILQISSYWKPHDRIVIEPKSLPRRFVQKW